MLHRESGEVVRVHPSRDYAALTPRSRGTTLEMIGLWLNDDVVLHAAHAVDAPGDLLGLGAVGITWHEAAQLHDILQRLDLHLVGKGRAAVGGELGLHLGGNGRRIDIFAGRLLTRLHGAAGYADA